MTLIGWWYNYLAMTLGCSYSALLSRCTAQCSTTWFCMYLYVMYDMACTWYLSVHANPESCGFVCAFMREWCSPDSEMLSSSCVCYYVSFAIVSALAFPQWIFDWTADSMIYRCATARSKKIRLMDLHSRSHSLQDCFFLLRACNESIQPVDKNFPHQN